MFDTYTASALNPDWLNDDGEGVATANDGVATASDSNANEPSEQETAVEHTIVQEKRIARGEVKEIQAREVEEKASHGCTTFGLCQGRAADKKEAD